MVKEIVLLELRVLFAIPKLEGGLLFDWNDIDGDGDDTCYPKPWNGFENISNPTPPMLFELENEGFGLLSDVFWVFYVKNAKGSSCFLSSYYWSLLKFGWKKLSTEGLLLILMLLFFEISILSNSEPPPPDYFFSTRPPFFSCCETLTFAF